MNVFEHWQTQKEGLRTILAEQPDAPSAVYQVRHAIAQTEQNALAEMHDDVLRQQAGVLMSCIKQSVGFIEAQFASQVWVPRSMKNAVKKPAYLYWIAAAAQGIGCILCYDAEQWGLLVLLLAVLGLGLWQYVTEKKTLETPESTCKVTLTPDIDCIFTLLDDQMRAVDRYLNDFGYLNDQLRCGAECSDTVVLARASDLMEALYDVADEERETIEEAACRLLEGMGMRAVEYSEENRRLFNALPSKSMTRTLSPAIVSIKDDKLLKRGTAAVRSGAA